MVSQIFKNPTHKNLELLRFYLCREIRDNDINSQSRSIIHILNGSIFAAIFDISVTLVFYDYLSTLSVFRKIVCILALLVWFVFITIAVSKILHYIESCNREIGRSAYKQNNVIIKINEFDNIACGGLLICKEYIGEYNESTEECMKQFYRCEIMHYLKKAGYIYDCINSDKALYVSDNNERLISQYRLDNFQEILESIYKFLESISCDINDEGYQQDLCNLSALVYRWKK